MLGLISSLWKLKGIFYHLIVVSLLSLAAFFLGGKKAFLSALVSGGLVGLNFLFFPFLWDLFFIKKLKLFTFGFFVLKYALLGFCFYFFLTRFEIEIFSFSAGLFSVVLTWALLLLF